MAGDTDEHRSAGLTSQLRQAVVSVHRHAVSALLTGDAPSLAEVAEIASRDTTGVAQAVAWLTSEGALERDGDRLVGAHGLTHRTTPHLLAISNRAVHTWSALDALAIPIVFEATARVTTACPTCGQNETSFLAGNQFHHTLEPALGRPVDRPSRFRPQTTR